MSLNTHHISHNKLTPPTAPAVNMPSLRHPSLQAEPAVPRMTPLPKLVAPPLVTETEAVKPPRLRLQGTLLGSQPAQLTGATLHRTQLDTHSWIDHASGWLGGSDTLMATLWEQLPWRAGRRPMFDKMVDVPRLSAFPLLADESLPSIVVDCSRRLQRRYDQMFDTLGANLYRDGQDSVAWHSDRVGRRVKDPLVAVLSLGAPRPFLLRPKDRTSGAGSLRVLLHPGDLLVMGGACQHRWEHAVPKVSTSNPRISLTFRHD